MEWNPEVKPHQVALVCHPHPVFGGTMHNKVVYRAAKSALAAGSPPCASISGEQATARVDTQGERASGMTFAPRSIISPRISPAYPFA